MSPLAVDVLRSTEPVDDVPAAFSQLLEERFAQRPGERFVVFLSGGALAAACYRRAADDAQLDWGRVDVYLGDERLVPPGDPDANQRLVREQLIEPLGGVGSFTPMSTEGDPEHCAAAYEVVLRRLVDGPGVDLVHLGLGPDGHTASLFEDAPSLAEEDRLVVVTQDPKDRNPHPRLSVTYPFLERARLIAFTTAGPEKHDAVSRLLAGADLPAARVRAAEIRWLLDDQALVGKDGR